MLEAEIDRSELERLVEKLERSPKVLAQAKRQAMETAAPKLLSAARSEIGGSGKVQRWQEAYTGSKGGYAAVRPKKKTYVEIKGKQKDLRAPPKKYAVGYITNAINSGHRFPRDKLGYRSRTGSVPGKQFYQRAQDQAETVAREAAEQIVQTLTDHLGG